MDLFGDLPDPAEKEKERDVVGTKTIDQHVDINTDTETKVSAKRKLHQTDMGSFNHTKKVSPTILELQGFHAESIGEREEMQDACVILDDYLTLVEGLQSNVERLAYYAVFDGHAGARAAKYGAENLHKNLAERFPRADLATIQSEYKKCSIEAFKKTDEGFLKEASKMKPAWKDGTTAVNVLVLNNTLYVSNLGDSKAILCRFNADSGKHSAISLTKDHNPTQYEERIRIQKAGGHVKDGRVMGSLEVSRSIGDGPYKNHGVSCIPDIKKCQLTTHDKYIMIACDGLWKAFTPDAAIEFTNNVLLDETIEAREKRSCEEMRWLTACLRLVGEAVKRLSGDNVTVVLVRVGHS